MLQAMRTGSKSIFVKLVIFGLLTMATLGLALMDVNGFFSKGMQNNDVANFDGTKITAVEFNQILRPFLQQRKINTDEAWRSGLIHNVLIGEVQNRLLTKAAWDAGLNVSDETVSGYIRGILAPLVSQGMTEKDALDRILRAQGMTEKTLVNSVRREIGMETLLKAVAMGAHPSQQLVMDAWGYRHEQRIGDYFTLSGQDVAKTIPAPSADELKSYYQTTKANFMLPEFRKIAIVTFGSKDIKDMASVSDEALKAAYDERKDEFTAPETRMIAQAILPDEESAKKVVAAVHAGKTLADAAKSVSGGRYVEPESYEATSLVPEELSAPAFAAKKGAVTAPVKSPLGWHVLDVTSIKAGGAQSFDAVKESLSKELSHQGLEDRLYKLSEEVSDALAGGANLKAISDDYNFSYQYLPVMDASGKTQEGKDADLKNIPDDEKILNTAFSLSEGTPSNLLETPSGEFIIVEVLEITPAKERPFETVRDAVTKTWVKEKTDAALGNLAQKLTSEIEKSGDIAASAKAYGKNVLTSTAFKRTENAPKTDLPRGFIPTLFSVPHKGGVTALDNPDGSMTIIRLKQVIVSAPPTADKNKEELAGLENIIKRSLQEDVLEQYRLWLTLKAKLEINDAAIDQLYRPKDKDDPTGDEIE